MMQHTFFRLLVGALFLALVAIPYGTTQAFELQWFGQAAFKITTPGGKVILVDPYGTFPPLKGTPEQFKQALGDFETQVVVMQPGEAQQF